MRVRACAREDPECPANAVIEPLMLAVLAERTGGSPLSMMVGIDWTEVARWSARLPRSLDGPAFLANQLKRLALVANACFRAFTWLFTSVCNVWVRIMHSYNASCHTMLVILTRSMLLQRLNI